MNIDNNEEKAALCAMNRLLGYKPKTATALISELGSASAVFNLSEDEKDIILGPYSRIRNELNGQSVETAAKELRILKEMGIDFIGLTSEFYPALLRECEDAPVGLYIKSDSPPSQIFRDRRNVAVVGTRDISPYGKEWCRKVVTAFANSLEKPTIVSGLALGTDICAHLQALSEGLPTIAVMATGPESTYPSRHINIAERISRTPGCALITDYPPQTPPLPMHFLRRNRIIAGLSEATILIESKIKGGGMMTASLAHGYNREVYALPGRIDDIRSQGCNSLISQKKAEAIISPEEILDGLGMKHIYGQKCSDIDLVVRRYGAHADPARVTRLADMLIEIRKNRGISIGLLARALGLEYGVTSELAHTLELDGLIEIDMMQRCTVHVCR